KLPRGAIGHKVLIGLPRVSNDQASVLQAIWSSFVFDFVSRQKIGGTSMAYFTFMQLPVPLPTQGTKQVQWIANRVDRLNAQCIEEESRQQLRAELDGLMFHVFGVARQDVEYILETFPIVNRKDCAEYGEYRTKRLILEKYDEIGRTLS